MRIMMIDDSKAVQAFVKLALAGKQVELIQTWDGAEGVKRFAELEGAPDLILLDWEMPVMDGPTAFAELKKLGNQTPVLMMTTRNSPDDISFMLAHGVHDYMLKPFTADILVEKIEMVSGSELKNVA